MLHTVKRRGTMETYRNEEQMKCLAKSEGCSVFRMENATGEGTIAMYELFPGVMLGFNDFHMDYFEVCKTSHKIPSGERTMSGRGFRYIRQGRVGPLQEMIRFHGLVPEAKVDTL